MSKFIISVYFIKYNKIFFYSIFLLAFLALGSISLYPIKTYDGFWHLQMGKDFIEYGISPWIDHYSYTYFEQPISHIPILFQTSLAFFVKTYGLVTGIHLYKFIIYFLLLWAFYLYCKQIRASWPLILIILPSLLFYLQIRANLRPELLSYVLIIASLILYFRANEQFNHTNLFYITLLLLFWVNWHVPIFGYLIIFALFVDKLFDKLLNKTDEFTWFFWCIWGLIIFMIGFINQNGNHFLFLLLSFNAGWKEIISEYRTLDIVFDNQLQVILLVVMSIYLSLYFSFKKKFGLVFLCLFLMYETWAMARLISATGLILSCLSLYALNQIDYKKLFIQQQITIKLFLISSSCFFVIYTSMLTYQKIKQKISTESVDSLVKNAYPIEMMSYMKKHYRGGNIFNDFDIGGYLIYSLAPNFFVYIDGRTNILYPFKFSKNYGAIRLDIKLLNNEIEKYNIDYILLKIDKVDFFNIEKNTIFKLDYLDENFFLFTREKQKFNLSSKLSLFPMCWEPKLNEQILSEKINSQLNSIEPSARIKSVFELIENYSSQEIKSLFFTNENFKHLTSTHELRLAAYMALKSNSYSLAIFLFSKLKVRNNMDLLMLSFAFAQQQQFNNSGQVISYILSKNISTSLHLNELQPFEKAILLSLIERLKEKIIYSKNTQEIINQLKQNFEPKIFNYTLPLKSIFPDAGCSQLFSK